MHLCASQLLLQCLDLSLCALQRQLLGGVVIGHGGLDDLRALGLGEALLGDAQLALQQTAAVLGGLSSQLCAGQFLGDASQLGSLLLQTGADRPQLFLGDFRSLFIQQSAVIKLLAHSVERGLQGLVL